MSVSKINGLIANYGNLGWGKTSGVGYKTKFLREVTGSDNFTMPSDWLVISEPTETQAVYGLFAVFNTDSNFLAFSVSGAYTVDWGDGIVENFNSGITAQHQYIWNNIPSSTLTSEGFRQVIVKITPQSGQNITNINLQRRHSSYASGTGGNSSNPLSPWLDLYIKATTSLTGTNLTVGSIGPTTLLSMLTKFTLDGGGNLSLNALLSGCSILKSASIKNVTSITNTQYLFRQCFSLKSVPLIDTSSVTNMTSMFDNCTSLQSVPLFNTSNVTDMSFMFATCSSLQSVPLFDTAKVTNMSSMFTNCTSLEYVSAFNTFNVTNMSSMFSTCRVLQSVPLFDTAKVTDMSSMFSQCSIIYEIPELSMNSVTNLTSFSTSCFSLKSAKPITPISISYAGGMLSATELNRIYTSLPSRLNTSASSASGNGTLVTYTTTTEHGYVPGMIVTVTGFTPTGYNLVSAKIRTIPSPTTFTLPSTVTGISSGTGTITPAALTLTVSNNWGTATDTPSIATAKGWTVTG